MEIKDAIYVHGNKIDSETSHFYFKYFFNDLKARIPTETCDSISKIVFSNYINLPLFISDRIYNLLKNKHTDNLKELEFIEGMSKFYFGDDKFINELFFKICDFYEIGKIHFENVEIILSFLCLCKKDINKKDELLNILFLNDQCLELNNFTKILLENKKIKNNLNIFIKKNKILHKMIFLIFLDLLKEKI